MLWVGGSKSLLALVKSAAKEIDESKQKLSSSRTAQVHELKIKFTENGRDNVVSIRGDVDELLRLVYGTESLHKLCKLVSWEGQAKALRIVDY